DGVLHANVKNSTYLQKKLENLFVMKQVGEKVYIDMLDANNEWSDITSIHGRLYIHIPKQIDVRVHSNNGFIVVDHMKHSATLQTANVDIHIENSKLGNNSLLETSTGNITFNILPDDQLTLDATTQFGNIKGNVNWKITEQIKDPDNPLKKAISKNGKASIILSTDTGNIIASH